MPIHDLMIYMMILNFIYIYIYTQIHNELFKALKIQLRPVQAFNSTNLINYVTLSAYFRISNFTNVDTTLQTCPANSFSYEAFRTQASEVYHKRKIPCKANPYVSI